MVSALVDDLRRDSAALPEVLGWLDQRFEPRRIVTAMPKEATEAEKSRPVPSVAATLRMEPYSCHQKSNPCM